MGPIVVEDVAGRVLEGLDGIADADLMTGMSTNVVVKEGVDCSVGEAGNDGVGSIDTGQEEERRVEADHLTRSHGGRRKIVMVVAVADDDSDTRLDARRNLNCRVDSRNLPGCDAEPEVPEY